MVKNFRVVVMSEVVRGPKVVTVRKMKFWRQTESTGHTPTHTIHLGRISVHTSEPVPEVYITCG